MSEVVQLEAAELFAEPDGTSVARIYFLDRRADGAVYRCRFVLSLSDAQKLGRELNEMFVTVTPKRPACVCSTQILLAKGCQCGGT
jgi:hypothetical protein